MISKFRLNKDKCCSCYIPKSLKNEINKLKKELQKEENKKKGRKAHTVTFAFAAQEFAKRGKKKWF